MKRTLLPLIFLLPMAVPAAHADDASKRTKIIELLNVLKVNQVGQQIVDGAAQQSEQLGHREFGATETPEQQKQVSDLKTKIVGLMTPAVEWKSMEPEFITLYSNAYTEPEIDGILNFYKSPAGQALLNKGPEIGQRSNQVVQQHMSSVQPQLRQAVQDFAKQAAPANSAAPAGTGAPSTRPAPSLSSPTTKTPAPSSK